MEGQTEVEWENYYAPYKRWYGMREFPTGDGLSIFFRNIPLSNWIEHEMIVEET